MTYGKPSIVLAELWERQSGKGNQYFSGYLGNLSIALLRDGEREHPTRPGETVTVWKLVAQERDRTARMPASASSQQPPSPSQARPPPVRRFRREGARARQERVSSEIARSYGLDGDPNDDLPF
jgi:hypothetical protein